MRLVAQDWSGQHRVKGHLSVKPTQKKAEPGVRFLRASWEPVASAMLEDSSSLHLPPLAFLTQAISFVAKGQIELDIYH